MSQVDQARRYIISVLKDGKELQRRDLFRGTKWSRRTLQRALRQVATWRYEGFGRGKKVWYKLDRTKVQINREAIDKYGMILFRLREEMEDTEDPAQRKALAQVLRRLK